MKKIYGILKIKEGQCSYCLRNSTTADHFRGLVENGNPSGYVTDVFNLVPCCSDCNSKKGKKHWEQWYTSCENIERLKGFGLTDQDIQNRVLCLQEFANLNNEKLDYKEILGEDLWEEYKERKNNINTLLKENQVFCDELNQKITNYYKKIRKN